MIKSPCKGCEKRYIGCHSECDRYIAFDKENKEEKEIIYKSRCRDREIGIYKLDATMRLKRNRRR